MLLSKQENLNQKIKEKSEELEFLEGKNDSFEDEKLSKINKLNDEINKRLNLRFNFSNGDIEKILEQIAKKKEEISSLKKQSVDANKTLLDETVLSDLHSEYQKEETSFIRELDKIKFSLTQAKVEKEKLQKTISSEQKDAISLSDKISSLSESELSVLKENKTINEIVFLAKKLIDEQIKSINEESLAIEKRIELFSLKSKDMALLVEEKRAKKEKTKLKLDSLSPLKKIKQENEDKIGVISDLISDLIDEKEKISNELNERQKVQTEIETINREVVELKEKKNPFIDLIDLTKDKLADLKTLVDNNDKILKKSKEELEYLLFWKSAFSPLGIRSFIFDEVLELLNQKVQNNLNDLFEGALSVIFESESKNQKGAPFGEDSLRNAKRQRSTFSE